MITIADPLRAGNELSYYPGEICARMADVLVISKVNSATKEQVEHVTDNLGKINPRAKVFNADSIVRVDNPKLITGKKVLIVEDGPTITHGGMQFGAGTIAAREYGAAGYADARQYAVGTIKDTLRSIHTLRGSCLQWDTAQSRSGI